MAVTSRDTRQQPDLTSRFVHEFAVSDADVKACQQLRYKIFAEEMGAQIDGGEDKRDVDHFDAFCHHLIVRDRHSNRIIACTRLLTCEAAAQAGGFYSSGEFDLDRIAALPDRKVEVGRTCVDAEFRTGAIISKLWQGLTAFVAQHNYRYLFGCASVGLDDGGEQASAILDKIERRYMAPETIHVTPKRPYRLQRPPAEVAMRMPPLLKAYVSLGAKACGAPYWDESFNCCDVFMLLDIHEMAPRYVRRFMPADNAPARSAGHHPAHA